MDAAARARAKRHPTTASELSSQSTEVSSKEAKDSERAAAAAMAAAMAAAAANSASSPERAEFDRRYEFLKMLAEGAFGTVWSGRDRDKVRRREQVVKVAIKVVMHGGEDTELVRNEVKMHQKLFTGGGSPLLVRLFDVLFEEARAMLVVELCDGEALCELLDKAPRGRLPEACAAPIVRQLCTALAFMHAKHVAHLDVKPENVLVHSRQSGSSEPRLRLLDYGSACAMDRPDAPALGLVQDFGGTDRYMAPERLALPNLNGSRWFGGAPADIYSLGSVVLPVLLGGGAADALATKAAAMAKAAEAAATARAKVSKATAAAAPRARQLSQTMATAAESAAAEAGSAAAQVEATLAEVDVRLSVPAMDFLLMVTRVEPTERPAAPDLLRHEWLLERRTRCKGGLTEREVALPAVCLS